MKIKCEEAGSADARHTCEKMTASRGHMLRPGKSQLHATTRSSEQLPVAEATVVPSGEEMEAQRVKGSPKFTQRVSERE